MITLRYLQQTRLHREKPASSSDLWVDENCFYFIPRYPLSMYAVAVFNLVKHNAMEGSTLGSILSCSAELLHLTMRGYLCGLQQVDLQETNGRLQTMRRVS